MPHANAALTPRARLRLAQLVVDRGWTYTAAAKMFMVAPRTARKWADRYRGRGPRGHGGPQLTTALEPNQDLSTARAADRAAALASPARTVADRRPPRHTGLDRARVLVRCRINRLSHIDRVTGEPLRRYEHPHPGSLIHVDVTEFANIPDGGGHKFLSRRQSNANAAATARRTGVRGKRYRPVIGTAFVHTVIDDHSRTAYAEICPDEKADTAIGVLRRAVAWFDSHGVTVERVSTDNGSAYRPRAWRDACADLAITAKRTRPYRPQTNGKIERFHRTLADGWAYARFYGSEAERRMALPGWLHFYNHHRHHSAIGAPPISRIQNNLPGQHS